MAWCSEHDCLDSVCEPIHSDRLAKRTSGCPFYQHVTHMSNISGPLIHSLPMAGSNACGLKIGSHSPCYMELNRLLPNWDACIIKSWLAEVVKDAGAK